MMQNSTLVNAGLAEVPVVHGLDHQYYAQSSAWIFPEVLNSSDSWVTAITEEV